MSDVTELKCWPCCVDAIDWSQDGIIAVSSIDNVELLFPNTNSNDTEEEISSWQHIPLPVSFFSFYELPEKEPAPVSTYSIGEEISESLPVSVAWSPPGLAKHRRCALGALTSNLVLSIWSADAKPQDKVSWERQLLVNDALAAYFAENAHEESIWIDDPVEKMRLRTRIRAFAWAPSLPNVLTIGMVGSRLSWGQQLIALSNDDNQIAFVVVDSPTSTLGADEDWSAEVLNHCSVRPGPETSFTDLSTFTFDDMMRQRRYISCLAWSPWTIRGNCYQSVLVYATGDDVRARLVTYRQSTISFGGEIIYQNVTVGENGPMRWCPWVESDDKLKLAIFANNGLVCLSISATDATEVSRTFHDLDGRWDEISGVFWEQVSKAAPRLHISSLVSTITCPTATLKLSDDVLSGGPSPNWREQISDAQALFSAKKGLQGHVRSRVWGLSGSPLGDFIAACHTVHPSDMMEYGPPSDRRSTIAINGLRSYDKDFMEFPARDVTAEGVAFTLKKWAENTVEDVDHIPGFIEEMVNKIMKVYGVIQAAEPSESPVAPSYGSRDLNRFTQEFKRIAFLDPNSLKDRCSILATQVCSPNTSTDLAKTLIAYRLAQAVQTLPSALSSATPFSAEISSAHRQLINLINAVTDEASNQSELSSSLGADACEICKAVIPFTDLQTATCANGHEFPRCGLSFLAIQAPRITKYCGICNTPFFNDHFVKEQGVVGRASSRQVEMTEGEQPGTEDGDDRDGGGQGPPLSLARVLFLACDVCIYCGGKFTG